MTHAALDQDLTPGLGRIAEIGVATLRAPLPEPIRFGDWVMRHREFALVRLRAESGVEGFAFTLTREGPLAALIHRVLAHHYVGGELADPALLFERAQGSNLATLAAGTGLRALSIVDLAAWDLLARAQGISIAELLGGEPRALPATAIVGYPPTLGPEEVREQVEGLYAGGWRRFKLPIAATAELTRGRLRAAAGVAEDLWLGMDAAWVFRDAEAAAELLRSMPDVRLGWYEDVFPRATQSSSPRCVRVDTPIAMGDEQGGSYFPRALLEAGAVDVVRVDATCMGGLTRLRPLLAELTAAGVAFAPHMFAHVHSQIFGALGYDVPIEWGVPGTGVDQYADSLEQPLVRDGRMEPLAPAPGFGTLVNPEWIAAQTLDDPDGVVADLLARGPQEASR